MDLLWLTVGYLCLATVLIGVMLFGENPAFRGTPMHGVHWLITEGVWLGAEWLLIRLCGQRSQRWVESVMEYCCDRPNPTLQVGYMALVLVGYSMYTSHIFALLPAKWASDTHIWTGTAAVLVMCVAFAVACRSDPGIVTEESVGAHAALYPLDGVLWQEKTCVTCGWTRPARSKHCRVCGHCIARHDHHCGWINNCVGLFNHRWFLLFLVTNLVVTVYATVLAVLALLSHADDVGMLRHKFFDYHMGRVQTLRLPAAKVFEYLVAMAPLAVALTLFMAAATVLVLLFLAYQLFLIGNGITQYEVYRQRDLEALHWHQHQERAKQRQEGEGGAVSRSSAAASSGAAMSQAEPAKRRGRFCVPCVLWLGRRTGWLPYRAQWAHTTAPSTGRLCFTNRYHRGSWVRNLLEVLLPHHYLRQAAAAAAVAAGTSAVSMQDRPAGGTCGRNVARNRPR